MHALAVQKSEISNSPSTESANRPPNWCNKRLLLSQRSAGLKSAHAVVRSPERWAEDTGCHCASLSYSQVLLSRFEVCRRVLGDVTVKGSLFVRDVMLLEAPGSPLGRARELQAWKARQTLDSPDQ
jgi:hypothetical protein